MRVHIVPNLEAVSRFESQLSFHHAVVALAARRKSCRACSLASMSAIAAVLSSETCTHTWEASAERKTSPCAY